MNVILIGFRCSGKSTVGKELAARLGREFIDCDEYIERKTNLSIREIFDRHGESHFRVIESQAIAELAKLDGKVIATGGGAVLKHKNMQVLARNGKIFYLEVEPETAYQRLQGDPITRSRRPALTDEDPRQEVQDQIELRRPYYQSAAHHLVKTDNRSIADVTKEILTHLGAAGEERQDKDEALA